uniref:Cytochrome P450 n=1 Tax=Globisporangium ultimum (strain ATCC 200006 / CBS 805.95 / DAOM BR144) TaxID=431595 RepID=K3XBX3_GLOUD
MLVSATVSFAQLATALIVVAATGAGFACLKWLRRKLEIADGLAPIPGPKGTFLLGVLPELIRNMSRFNHFQEDLMLQYGGRVKLPWHLFSDGSVYISDPKDVKHILTTNFNNYIKAEPLLATFSELFSKSFFGLNHAHSPDNGAMWKLQRQVASKVFTTNNFKLFSEQIFHKYSLQMVDIINAQGGKCDMLEVASQYALQAIFDVGCGVPLSEVDEQLGLSFLESMRFVVNNIVDRILAKPYYKYLWWCMPSEYRLMREVKVMTAIADKILERRLKETDEELAPRSDIMSLFIKKARELSVAEGSSVLDLDTVRSIFLTFIFAGWDTTSGSITYAFYALIQNPQAQEQLFDELENLQKSSLTYDDIKKLKYLDAVVSESMRLYPIVPFDKKMAAQDDHLPDGTFIPAGTEIVYSPWYMGRHNPIWGDDPMVFRPERWLEMKTRPSVYDFPAFQAGPRICIGMNMALLETKMFIAVMVNNFRAQIQDGEQLEDRGYAISPTLTLKDGLPLQMTPRQVACAF